MIEVLASVTVVIILQYVIASNQHTVHLKFTQCYMYIISQFKKIESKKKERERNRTRGVRKKSQSKHRYFMLHSNLVQSIVTIKLSRKCHIWGEYNLVRMQISHLFWNFSAFVIFQWILAVDFQQTERAGGVPLL